MIARSNQQLLRRIERADRLRVLANSQLRLAFDGCRSSGQLRFIKLYKARMAFF